jgi:AcrR family transcriptional regulator
MYMSETSQSRSSRQDWLNQGLEILSAEGDRGLTVEALGIRMARTKGSFYHHFSAREDYVVQLLEYWERTFTSRLIEDLEPLDDPRHRLRVLGARTADEVDLRLERSIRVWSDREPLVREVLERVDGERERYLREQFEAAIGDPSMAHLAARAHMALLVGTQMLYQNLSRDELRKLNTFVDHLGFVVGAGRVGHDTDKETP